MPALEKTGATATTATTDGPTAARRATEEEAEFGDLPPAYSMPTPSSRISMRPVNFGRRLPGLPDLNFAAYIPPLATSSRDLVTVTIADSAICRSPQALSKLLSEQIALPPMSEIRIKGTHKEWGGDKVDFDIRLNMMRYFMPQNGDVGLSYSKLVSAGGKRKGPLCEDGASAIEQWAQAFCGDTTTEKCFCITRKLSNWDSEYLMGRILALAQSLNYKGTVEVTFPLTYQRLLVKNTQSFGSVLRSAFVGGGRYEVEVHWPYASHMPSDDCDAENRNMRTFLVRSEAGWFKDWKPVLRAAILGRRRGWIGLDDWVEIAMAPPVNEKPQPLPWGASH